jgi:hypothetical protein
VLIVTAGESETNYLLFDEDKLEYPCSVGIESIQDLMTQQSSDTHHCAAPRNSI